MGIKFAWKDIEDSKSDELDNALPEAPETKNENYDVWRYY